MGIPSHCPGQVTMGIWWPSQERWTHLWSHLLAVVTIPEGQTWGQHGTAVSDTAQNFLSFPGQLLVDPLCHSDLPSQWNTLGTPQSWE